MRVRRCLAELVRRQHGHDAHAPQTPRRSRGRRRADGRCRRTLRASHDTRPRRRGRSRRPSSGARRRARAPRLPRPELEARVTTPSRGALTSRTTGARGKRARSGSPPCARIQRSYARNADPSATSCFGASPPLLEIDAEIRESEQARRRLEDELHEVVRPMSGDRLHGLANLERISDRSAERLLHVGQQADDLAARRAGRDRPSARRGCGHRRGSS